MANKNQRAVDRLYKIIGHREFTARSAVYTLAEDGYRYTPHANALANLLKIDALETLTPPIENFEAFKSV